MSLSANTLYLMILACEVAFWVALGAGLACRYLWRRVRLSRLLLLCVPLIDAALLALTAVDLRNGATATFAHGLAAAYVAFTVVFGATVMRWADGWFAHRFAGGPAPREPASRVAAVRAELKLWGLCLIAIAIVYVLLTVLILTVNDPDRTQALQAWYRIPLGTAFFWFIFGPMWTLFFFKREIARTES